jgi:hypothetical protein
MNALAPVRPAELYQRRARLLREPAAAGQARDHIRSALNAWQVPVDPDVAILLTSDVVTDAILHGLGPSVTVAVRCSRGQLRVDVYDSAGAGRLPADGAGDRESRPELALVALLADDWGVFRTAAGVAVYFALTLRPA